MSSKRRDREPLSTQPWKPRRIPSLAVRNDKEIVFRHSLGSRIAGLVFALVPAGVAAYSLMAAPESNQTAAYAVFLAPGYGFFTLYLLSALGPNETRFDLENGTYQLRRFKPWPGRYASTWGMGVPLWEQETVGPVSDILRLRVQEVYWKRDHRFCLHIIWKDARRTPAFLAVLSSRADGEALMMQVAEAAGVLAFPGKEPALHGG